MSEFTPSGYHIEDIEVYFASGLMYYNTNISGRCPMTSDGETLICNTVGDRVGYRNATLDNPIYGVCGVCHGACEYVFLPTKGVFVQYECTCANSTDEHIYAEPMLTIGNNITNVRCLEYNGEDIYMFHKDNHVLQDEDCIHVIKATEF